jgi:uncharacterized membrane protein YhhN
MEKKAKLMDIMDRVKMDIAPFFLSLGIYTLLCVPMEQHTLFGMVIKCLPIIALQYFVYRAGTELTDPEEQSYQQKILVGLIFACIGDAFLDFPGYFLHGTISFGVAQAFNIAAFGFKPLNPTLALKILSLTSLPLLVILPKLNQEETKLLIAITLYTPLLKGMIWRAIARANFNDIDWPKVFGALGAISFGLSDSSLALNKYWKSLPYAQAIIMTTYYGAQFGIALSAVGNGKSQGPKKPLTAGKRNKSK